MNDRSLRDPLAKPSPVEFGRCGCPECLCVEPPEKGRDVCRLCRRGYHRPGARKPL